MKIGILGAGGRMGQLLIDEVTSDMHSCTLAAAVDREEATYGDIHITTDRAIAFEKSDVLIDFTAPKATHEHLILARQYKKPLVIGTTGLKKEQEELIAVTGQEVPVFYCANMSIGINVLAALVEQTAARLREEFDIEIFEAHHRRKVDAPSGTALMLGRAAATGRGANFFSVTAPERRGETGPRKPGDIGFQVMRGGDIAGEHTVTFAGDGERLELTHRATDRAIFARGAVKAALWLPGRAPAVYDMAYMLGI